jgi:rod shape-determining protein MreD
MNRIVERDGEIIIMRARAHVVPIASTILGSAAALIPVVATAPLLPPFGLLMLLGWRLLRPQLWPVWMGLPLGLIDDLLVGLPLGTSVILWTIALLILDTADQQLIWRDYWQEWLIGGVMTSACLAASVLTAHYVTGQGSLHVIVPQAIVSVLVFPAVLRLCARLDRWRLA